MSRTGPEIASLCGRGLAKGKRGVNDEEFKDICASGLRQAESIASYTDLKNRATNLKRRLKSGKITPAEALNELVAMAKPVSVKPEAHAV